MSAITGWKPKKLSELADYINGYAFKPDDWGKDGLPIIRIEQLKNPDAPADYFDGKLPPSKIIEDGDLIFSWSASLFLRIWRHGRAALNQHLFKVIEREGVDRAFLKAFIEFYLPALTAASHGSTMQHITRKELNKFGEQFPESKLEQTKIAEILSTVNLAIEQTEASIAKQQHIKTGLMQDLITRGIDEHGNLRSEQTHAFKDSPIGRIPVEWEVKQIEHSGIELIDGDRGENYPKQDDLLAEGHCLFMSAKNVTRLGLRFDECQFISESRDRKLGSGKVEFHDIILTTRGTVGQFAFVETLIPYENIRINSGMIIFRNREPDLDSEFLYESYRNHIFPIEFQQTVSGSAQPQLPARDLKLFHFLKPKQEEQRAITTVCSAIESVRSAEEAIMNKLSSLKVALMKDLLIGRKRVTALLVPEPKREKMYDGR